MHRLQVVATFGALSAKSDPFLLEVTHTIDSMVLKVRDLNDVARTTAEARLDQTKDFVLSISGTHLAGREVTLNDEAPFTAPADAFDLVRVPRQEDFTEGKGTHEYNFWARSGGITRRDAVTLRRWKLESCGWALADGTAPSGPVMEGTTVFLRATGWGFPDTDGFLLFKRNQAEFTLWEKDYGQNNTNVPQPWVNNDDHVFTHKGDVKDSVAAYEWKVDFDEEVDFLGLGRAEYYCEVTLHDQQCTSGELTVPSAP